VSGFERRLATATDFEQDVIDRLARTGWIAFPFGQALLSKQARDLLKDYEDGSLRPCLIRWMPDVITFRALPTGRVWMALIDAKACGGETDNYSVEMSAAETMEIFSDSLFTPSFFVFDDWRVLTPREVRQRGRQGPPPKPGRGSGTPYLLVAKRFGRPFDKIFPPDPRAGREPA
jgi:hypothetical protein